MENRALLRWKPRTFGSSWANDKIIARSGTEMTIASGYHTHGLSEAPEDTDVLLALNQFSGDGVERHRSDIRQKLSDGFASWYRYEHPVLPLIRIRTRCIANTSRIGICLSQKGVKYVIPQSSLRRV